MKTYQPMPPPSDPAQLPAYLRQEFARIAQAAQAGVDSVVLDVLYAEPDKTFAGMAIYADGVTWDPGSGEGLYRRNKGNSAWVFVG